ncbi:SGNH/GDSL hydrolase family protein [Phreatobacter stygius]|nr:SGNH/GDSL hydrolase family protein [Phreatobacter stygius]
MIARLAIALLAVLAPAAAEAACTVASVAAATPGGSLPQTAARLRAHQPLKILAIGSSSTAGFGGGGAGFANQLGPLIKSRAPQSAIEVVISGVPAETASGAAGRLQAEIAAHRPHLVVWQLGTNDANFGVSPESFRATVASGLAAIRGAGADAVLVDPQFSRWAEGSGATAIKARIIAEEGARRGVPVARRFAAMQRLAATNRPAFDGLISWDGLHLSPAGHACMAEQIAGTILRTARR